MSDLHAGKERAIWLLARRETTLCRALPVLGEVISFAAWIDLPDFRFFWILKQLTRPNTQRRSDANEAGYAQIAFSILNQGQRRCADPAQESQFMKRDVAGHTRITDALPHTHKRALLCFLRHRLTEFTLFGKIIS